VIEFSQRSQSVKKEMSELRNLCVVTEEELEITEPDSTVFWMSRRRRKEQRIEEERKAAKGWFSPLLLTQ
jgi:hypothetical protein